MRGLWDAPLAKGSQALYDRAKKTLCCVTCSVGAEDLPPPTDDRGRMTPLLLGVS